MYISYIARFIHDRFIHGYFLCIHTLVNRVYIHDNFMTKGVHIVGLQECVCFFSPIHYLVVADSYVRTNSLYFR